MACLFRMLWWPCWLSLPWILNKSPKAPNFTALLPCFTVGNTWKSSTHLFFISDMVHEAKNAQTKEPLCFICQRGRTTRRKKIACAKKQKEWTLFQWKSVLQSFTKIGNFWFHAPCLCEMKKMLADGFYMCVSPCESVRRRCDDIWGCFAGDTVDLLKIHGKLNQHGILHGHAIPSGLPFVGP